MADEGDRDLHFISISTFSSLTISHHELLPKVLYQPDPLQFTAMSVGYDVEEPGAM